MAYDYKVDALESTARAHDIRMTGLAARISQSEGQLVSIMPGMEIMLKGSNYNSAPPYEEWYFAKDCGLSPDVWYKVYYHSIQGATHKIGIMGDNDVMREAALRSIKKVKEV